MAIGLCDNRTRWRYDFHGFFFDRGRCGRRYYSRWIAISLRLSARGDYSTGAHDRLLASRLYLSDGRTALMMAANDVIYIGRDTAHHVRERIEQATGIPAANMIITATHTHSGPLTVNTLSNERDPAVPKTDPGFVEQFENGIVEAAVKAQSNSHGRRSLVWRRPTVRASAGTGTIPAAPSNPEVPVLAARRSPERRVPGGDDRLLHAPDRFARRYNAF